jgi:hypothetical protein
MLVIAIQGKSITNVVNVEIYSDFAISLVENVLNAALNMHTLPERLVIEVLK